MISRRTKFSLLLLGTICIISTGAATHASPGNKSAFMNNLIEGAAGSPLAGTFTSIIALSLICAYFLSDKINGHLLTIAEKLKTGRSLFSQLDSPEIKIDNDTWDTIDRHWNKAQKLKSYLTFVYGLPTMFGMLGTVCGLIASNLSDTKALAEKFSVAIVSTALGIVGYIIIRFWYFRIEHKFDELNKSLKLILKKKTGTWQGDDGNGE